MSCDLMWTTYPLVLLVGCARTSMIFIVTFDVTVLPYQRIHLEAYTESPRDNCDGAPNDWLPLLSPTEVSNRVPGFAR
ncbi:hypothetical protein E2P81_ATG07667 [Venturia nashicola]|nr:hypothetical protein E2P81_ATG07667 [Venturia nashicola]